MDFDILFAMHDICGFQDKVSSIITPKKTVFRWTYGLVVSIQLDSKPLSPLSGV